MNAPAIALISVESTCTKLGLKRRADFSPPWSTEVDPTQSQQN